MSSSILPVSRSSSFDAEQIEQFLLSSTIPVRLACNTHDGYPLLTSLWFFYEQGSLFCATHEGSVIARHLLNDPRCAFEIAVNEPPYKGVRGQGQARLDRTGAAEVLGKLIDRYLGGRESQLAKWLLGRSHEEYVIKIQADWISSWDYTARMAK